MQLRSLKLMGQMVFALNIKLCIECTCRFTSYVFHSLHFTWISARVNVVSSSGAKTINVFRACLGAQLTICAQK